MASLSQMTASGWWAGCAATHLPSTEGSVADVTGKPDASHASSWCAGCRRSRERSAERVSQPSPWPMRLRSARALRRQASSSSTAKPCRAAPEVSVDPKMPTRVGFSRADKASHARGSLEHG
jgi:hypothetical protein